MLQRKFPIADIRPLAENLAIRGGFADKVIVFH